MHALKREKSSPERTLERLNFDWNFKIPFSIQMKLPAELAAVAATLASGLLDSCLLGWLGCFIVMHTLSSSSVTRTCDVTPCVTRIDKRWTAGKLDSKRRLKRTYYRSKSNPVKAEKKLDRCHVVQLSKNWRPPGVIKFDPLFIRLIANLKWADFFLFYWNEKRGEAEEI